jgi:hypothetical protein
VIENACLSGFKWGAFDPLNCSLPKVPYLPIKLSNQNWEWVYWCNDCGVSYPKSEVVNAHAEKRKEQAKAIALAERQQKEKLAAYLRSLGINPDKIRFERLLLS